MENKKELKNRLDPFMETENCVNRLFEQYKKFDNLLIGYDYDDTLYDYWKLGDKFPRMIEILKRCSDLGLTMILLTSKASQEEMDEVIADVECLGIRVDYLNESPALPGSAKPYVNIMLDDKAGLGQAYEILIKTLDLIDKDRNESKKKK